MARRFAPCGDTPSGLAGEADPLSPPDVPDLATEATDDPIQAAEGRAAQARLSYGGSPGWIAPASAPPPERPPCKPCSDELYGRAVAVVLADRKASNDYLCYRLGIRYMRAQDLLERMEQEGIVGAPVYNGMRPILVPRPGTQEV
jgi:DNA segregation ATPase FtsK/SpoIIIE-like protein